MCILTAEEEAQKQRWLTINRTNIFARHSKPGHQMLAYSLAISTDTETAMILPLPVVPGSGDDALKFIDLSGYPDFFDDLASACDLKFNFLNEYLGDDEFSDCFSALPVHDVGDYEASYVPSMADFNRLDSRFRLSDDVWKKMPDYSNYGFAIFQLKISLSKTENNVHPMAFEFPTREPEKIFFPTVHVHDGDYHDQAEFLHALYCQLDDACLEFIFRRDQLTLSTKEPSNIKDWFDQLKFMTGKPLEYFLDSNLSSYENWYFSSQDKARNLMKIDKCQNLIDPGKKIHGMTLLGEYKNMDTWLGGIVEQIRN
jgi:hypothetical protein